MNNYEITIPMYSIIIYILSVFTYWISIFFSIFHIIFVNSVNYMLKIYLNNDIISVLFSSIFWILHLLSININNFKKIASISIIWIISIIIIFTKFKSNNFLICYIYILFIHIFGFASYWITHKIINIISKIKKGPISKKEYKKIYNKKVSIKRQLYVTSIFFMLTLLAIIIIKYFTTSNGKGTSFEYNAPGRIHLSRSSNYRWL